MKQSPRFMSFYQRNLPHWQPGSAVYFITANLVGALPKEVIEEMQSLKNEMRKNSSGGQDELEGQIQQKIFQKYEAVLDKGEIGPWWLADESVANLIEEALHHRDENQYDLYAYCVMSNHIHIVFKLLDKKHQKNDDTLLSEYPVTNLMKNFKSYTAVQANKILNRNGQFWHRESFDRVIRDADELDNSLYTEESRESWVGYCLGRMAT